MRKFSGKISRRNLIGGVAAGSLLSISGIASSKQSGKLSTTHLPSSPIDIDAMTLAKNENYWREVARYYDRTLGITNLEHGYWGKMAKPVQNKYIAATKMVNAQNSFYARKDYDADYGLSVQRVAWALGVNDDEIVLTRNATEAIHNLTRQYRGFKDGDYVLYTDIDYPSFKETMIWLEKSSGVKSVQLKLPSRSNQQDILNRYIEIFDQ